MILLFKEECLSGVENWTVLKAYGLLWKNPAKDYPKFDKHDINLYTIIEKNNLRYPHTTLMVESKNKRALFFIFDYLF